MKILKRFLLFWFWIAFPPFRKSNLLIFLFSETKEGRKRDAAKRKPRGQRKDRGKIIFISENLKIPDLNSLFSTGKVMRFQEKRAASFG